MRTYSSADFLHHVVLFDVVAISIGSDSSHTVGFDSNLTRLERTNGAHLIEDSESVSLDIEDDSHC